MIYLTRMVGRPVIDAAGDEIGTIHDVAIATGEIFPRVTSLAFVGPDKTPFMLSWRKFVQQYDGDQVTLNVARPELRFSYLQPDEVLLARDLLNQQIVDTQGMKVVRVNDLKLSESRNQLRLLGAEVGARGILRAISPRLESAVETLARLFHAQMHENIIAWNYMELLDRDLSHVQLSVTHKRLHELHPADIADVLEQLSPAQRAKVFAHLDNTQAAETISELEDAFQADVIDDLGSQRASDILEIMDPDDAADIIGDLPYDKAEALLRLMGVNEAAQVRALLGYREKTAGGIMTSEVTTVTEDMTVGEVIEHLRGAAAENENIYYIYVVDAERHLDGVISLRDLIVAVPETPVSEIVERDVFRADVDEDQEDVADMMSKYDLLALPVVDENGVLLGMVTVDDALDVMEEESAEDLAIATGSIAGVDPTGGLLHWVQRRGAWMVAWGLAAIFVAVIMRMLLAPAAGADPRSHLLFAALYLPFMWLSLRIAEEVSDRAAAQLIEGAAPDERPSASRRFLADAGGGIVLGLVAGAVATMLIDIVGPALLETRADLGFIGTSVALGAVVTITTLLTVLTGTAFTVAAELAADRDRSLSPWMITVSIMVLSAAYFAAGTAASWSILATIALG